VHALRNLHHALVPDGLIVDTQPISAQPRVLADNVELGRLDMREWADTVGAVDERFAVTIAAGLYELQHECTFAVTSTFDDGQDCLTIAGSWRGTSVPPALSRRLAATSDRFDVEQQVRLRLLRRSSHAT
jgi:hypothetical protein